MDTGEGAVDVVIADGDDDKPYRKKHMLWGEDEEVDVFLVRITDEETQDSVEVYILAALLR